MSTPVATTENQVRFLQAQIDPHRATLSLAQTGLARTRRLAPFRPR
jgi:hypothetical protein